jgi:hypothetical protein
MIVYPTYLGTIGTVAVLTVVAQSPTIQFRGDVGKGLGAFSISLAEGWAARDVAADGSIRAASGGVLIDGPDGARMEIAYLAPEWTRKKDAPVLLRDIIDNAIDFGALVQLRYPERYKDVSAGLFRGYMVVQPFKISAGSTMPRMRVWFSLWDPSKRRILNGNVEFPSMPGANVILDVERMVRSLAVSDPPGGESPGQRR